ncbi:MAG: type II and III secretion system protein family protein [Kiloniellales bacterium]
MNQTRCKGILRLLLVIAAFWPLAAGAQQQMQSGEIVPPSGEQIMIQLDQGKLLRLAQPAASVFIVNPNVADVTVRTNQLVYLFGRGPGRTSLYALDAANNIILNTDVVVQHNITGLKQALDALVPAADIGITSVEGALILDGAVESATEAENVRRLAARFIGRGEEVINRLAVTEPNQINLRVRVAEASRDVLNRFGFNWDYIFDFGKFAGALVTGFPTEEATSLLGIGFGSANHSVDGLIDALADDGLITILAEPNLTALSGETASFLAGGEFPIPVSSTDDRVTIEFRPFGVSLSFTPTIISGNRINLRVRPEVSSLSTAGAVSINGFEIPALSIRRAETTVELGSGQSFAIAGLLQDNSQELVNRIPGLGDLPILGQLFRSERFERRETELVIIVTPYIVKPVSDRIPLPTDPYTKSPPNAVALRTQTSRTIPVPAAGPSIAGQPGTAGYILD